MSISYVDFNTVSTVSTQPALLIAQICLGLLNRHPATPKDSVTQYFSDLKVTYSTYGDEWLSRVAPNGYNNITLDEFTSQCFSSDVVAGYIKYDYETQKHLVPNLVTLAAVKDSILMEDDDDEAVAYGLELVFDATVEWKDFDAYDATRYMFEHHISDVKGIAKSNPGIDEQSTDIPKPLNSYMNAALVDFIVKERLFNFFMQEGCIPGTREHELTKEIAAWEGFETPTAVWGYDNTYSIKAGSKFEAETDCVPTLGQVASSGFPNLSFYSQSPPIEAGDLVSSPYQDIEYDPTKTYVSFLIGDGDNLRFLVERHLQWFETRKEFCFSDANWTQYNITEENACFPLVWSMSPKLLEFAPQFIKSWYDDVATTGNDSFVLPPSGDLYSYPGAFSDADQDVYKKRMQSHAELMDIGGTVHWEFPLFSTWGTALSYFEKYAADEEPGITGFHCVNVPYFEPIIEIFGAHDKKILNDRVVLFKSEEWRGGDHQSPVDIAKRLNGYEEGSVKSIYITSDGGFTFTDLYEMVGMLDMDRVVIVNQEQLVELALAAEKTG